MRIYTHTFKWLHLKIRDQKWQAFQWRNHKIHIKVSHVSWIYGLKFIFLSIQVCREGQEKETSLFPWKTVHKTGIALRVMAEFKSLEWSSRKYRWVYSFRLHDPATLTWPRVGDLTCERLNIALGEKPIMGRGKGKKRKNQTKNEVCTFHTIKITFIQLTYGNRFIYSAGWNRHRSCAFPRHQNPGHRLILSKLGLKHPSL